MQPKDAETWLLFALASALGRRSNSNSSGAQTLADEVRKDADCLLETYLRRWRASEGGADGQDRR